MFEEDLNLTNEEYDALELVNLILSNMNRGTKLLRIPIKTFLFEEAENILRTAVDIYNEYGVVTITEMVKKSKEGKFDYTIFVKGKLYENLETKSYYSQNYDEMINFYQRKVIENFKNTKTKQATSDFQQKKISQKDFVKKLNEIEKYKFETGENKFITMKDIPSEAKEKIFIRSGTYQLDNLIRGFALGQLSVWSGSNGSGKSSFLNQITLESIEQNFNVAVYSGELENTRLMTWILLQAAGKNNVMEKHNFFTPTPNARDKILYWLNEKLFVFSDKEGNDPDVLFESIKDVVKKKNVKMVIVDNLMSLDLKDTNNKYDEQGRIVKELSALAKELEIHIHFVCHPRKSTNFLRKNDISGTADITNLADNVFIIHRTNNDFKKGTKEMFGLREDDPMYQFSNVIEVCKNREDGVQDKFVGTYFEIQSKRLLNSKEENRRYAWEMMR